MGERRKKGGREEREKWKGEGRKGGRKERRIQGRR